SPAAQDRGGSRQSDLPSDSPGHRLPAEHRLNGMADSSSKPVALFDGLKRAIGRIHVPGLRRSKRWLKRWLPTRLYTRSVLIVIIPMLLLQTVVAAVFMERHWRMVTERLSEGTTRDIAALIAVIEAYPDDPGYSNI